MSHEDRRTGRSAAWGVAAVVFAAGAFATWPVAVAPKSTFPIWPTYVFAGVAALALYMCFATIWGWWPALGRLKESKQQSQEPEEPPRRLITDRWQYAPAAFSVGTLANLGHRAFSHHSYMQPDENKPPAVRVGAFIACGPLADDEPTAEHLRSLMRDCLSQPEMMDLVGKLTDIDANASWHSQPGHGRFNLEADLLSAAGSGRVLASALLLLPERSVMRYGKDRAGAELYLHVDLSAEDGVPVRAGIAEWHDRFTAALAIPGLLARFLERAGLTPSGDPAARFAVQVQARPTAATGLDEIVDFGDLAVLSPRRYSVQFDGWAVADQQGKAAGAISRRFLIELCEIMGRTGYDDILADLAGDGPRYDTPAGRDRDEAAKPDRRDPAEVAAQASPLQFEVRPVQGPGQNIWWKVPDREYSAISDPELFKVRLHVQFWTRDDAELINLDLMYDWPGTAPERQSCEIDGVPVNFDASYRFKRPIPITAGKTADVVISREFRTARVIGNDTDYRTARVRFEVGTPSGLRDLDFAGTLRPGGEVDDVEIRLTGSPALAKGIEPS